MNNPHHTDNHPSTSNNKLFSYISWIHFVTIGVILTAAFTSANVALVESLLSIPLTSLWATLPLIIVNSFSAKEHGRLKKSHTIILLSLFAASLLFYPTMLFGEVDAQVGLIFLLFPISQIIFALLIIGVAHIYAAAIRK